MVQLAKVMEHQHKDNIAALDWTNRAIEQLEVSRSGFSDVHYRHQI